MSPTVFISAGEASGEHYGALLIAALKKQLAARGQTASFFGMGGPRMAGAGLEIVTRSEDVAVMGVTEIIRHLPRIYREFRKLKQAIRNRKPEVAVLIDFPDIHFKLAKEFHRLGIPAIFFVSPQLWAWKKRRIELVRKYVDRMLVIFPFEEAFYRERGIAAEFVGHPLADLPLPGLLREEFAARHQLDPARIWIALLPGSRMHEIKDNLPDMVDAAILLSSLYRVNGEREPQFILPLAPTLTPPQRHSVEELVNRLCQDIAIRIASDAAGAEGAFAASAGAARAALYHARVSIVASGTATVEAALIGNPFVVVYRVSPITYAVAKRVVSVPHVAMANLIAGKRIVPELIQHDFTPLNIVKHLECLLPDGPDRQSMMQELEAIGKALRTRPTSNEPDGLTAIERVAAIVLEQLDAVSPAITLHS